MMNESNGGRWEGRKEIQLGGGYSVPWDMGRSGQSRHGWATRHAEKRAHPMLVKCSYEVTMLPSDQEGKSRSQSRVE